MITLMIEFIMYGLATFMLLLLACCFLLIAFTTYAVWKNRRFRK